MTDGRHISQEDLALYAMQALSLEESAPIRVHLAECAPCRAELAALSGDLALVAMSVEQQPVPQGARQRFLDRIAADAASAQPPQKSAAPVVVPVIPIDAPRPARRIAAWIPWAAVAATILIAVALQWQLTSLKSELQVESAQLAQQSADSARARQVLEVLTAPNAQRVVLTAAKTPPAPTARAVYLPSRGALILQASNLAQIPTSKVYELWVIPATGAPIPAGLFRPDASGSASVVLPQLPKGVPAKAFGVTIENAGGSASPTAPIVLSGAAPAAGE
jgi:Anti-sigma-K factor rskA